MNSSKHPFGLLRGAIALVAAAALVSTAACGAGGAAQAEGKPSVLASFYPLGWLAGQVGGDTAAVKNLTKPGAEPHDLELTPKQTVEVGKAKLVVYIKGLQPAVDDAVKEHAKDRQLEAAALVKTLPAPEEGHEHEGEEEHEKHSEEYDPHLWLDPERFATVATALGERLAKADSDHAKAYRERAGKAAAELRKLDQDFRTGLGSCRKKTIVTSHAAFGYLANRYGLTQVSIAGVDPQAEPSPKRLAELSHTVRDTKVTTIFTETLVSPKVAQTLAKEAGVKTATLDPVEGLRPGARDDYLSIMRQNLGALRVALECQ